MAQFQENVKVAQDALAAAQRLYEDSKRQEAVGALAPLDVVSAQSAMAAAERDLVLARTNFQIQEITLKNLLSKRIDSELESAEIVTTDPLPEPRDSDIPTLQDVLTEAFRSRPDLQVAQMNLLNEQISTQYTANNLLPTGNVFGQYAASGSARQLRRDGQSDLQYNRVGTGHGGTGGNEFGAAPDDRRHISGRVRGVQL